MNHLTKIVIVIVCFKVSLISYAYSPEIAHQPLITLSMSLYNKCHPNDKTYRDHKFREYITIGDIAMDKGKKKLPGWHKVSFANGSLSLLKRPLNWHFYNPDRQHLSKQGWIDKSQKRLWERANSEFLKYKNKDKRSFSLGGIIHLIEDAGVPGHVIPVYHGPVAAKLTGKFSHLVNYMKDHVDKGVIKDTIDSIEPDVLTLSHEIMSDLAAMCVFANINESPDQIRDKLARKTLSLITQTVPDCKNGKFYWQDFWVMPKGNAYFGKYNIGNGPLFGQKGVLKKTFSDGETKSCIFRDRDPRYAALVRQLHIETIKADLKILRWASFKF